ncbi:MAG: hypothetical protein BM485_03265 [Desulfobulbaceae bacterium DB1]|nr:MAG: hypothetical protein BM485_03265 [Desulfobulbaceae bacterium DB1]
MIEHKKKGNTAGQLLGMACMLSLLAGCGAAKSSWEAMSPKKKVPPYEEVKGSGQVPESAGLPASEDVMSPESVIPVQPRSPVYSLREILPDRAFLAGRKDVYGEQAQQWRELADSFAMYDYPMPEKERWRECSGLLSGIVEGYEKLNALLDEEGVGLEQIPSLPFVVFQQDIDFYEKDCRAVFAVAAGALPGQLDKYRDVVSRQGEDVLRYRAQQGDSAGVISAYENLRAAHPDAVPSIEARRVYGQALQEEGRLAESAAVFLDVAGAMNDLEGWPLRVQSAEIFFALGEFAKARREYEHVAGLFSSVEKAQKDIAARLALLEGQGTHDRELDLFRRSLFGWMTFDGQNVPSPLVEGVRLLEEEFPGSNYAGAARSLLDGLSGKVESGGDEAPAAAEEVAAEIRPPDADVAANLETLRMGALEGQWNDAVAMLDQLQFDQAITLFEQLADNEAYRLKAQAKIVEASTLAAAELRKEAAAFFVKSRNVQNPEQKGKLLMESRRLLVQVTEKYPQAEIIDKVKQNLQAIEEQLARLNPGLLEQ